MLRKAVTRQIVRAKSDRSHLAGITPKSHENRGSSLTPNLAGQLTVSLAEGTFSN